MRGEEWVGAGLAHGIRWTNGEQEAGELRRNIIDFWGGHISHARNQRSVSVSLIAWIGGIGCLGVLWLPRYSLRKEPRRCACGYPVLEDLKVLECPECGQPYGKVSRIPGSVAPPCWRFGAWQEPHHPRKAGDGGRIEP